MNFRKHIILLLLTQLLPALKIGDIAPEFSLYDESNQKHTLSDYDGKNVILYFYPKDNTPGCTKEACSFRDTFKQITELNSIILGVSYDSIDKHKSFKSKYSLPFTLLSDSTGSVTKLYGANGWFFPKRKTYIIDKNGVIIEIYNKVDISTHIKDIVELLSH